MTWDNTCTHVMNNFFDAWYALIRNLYHNIDTVSDHLVFGWHEYLKTNRNSIVEIN